MAECKRCAEIRAMTPDQLTRFLLPLLGTPNAWVLGRLERLREVAIRKHAATHAATTTI